MHELTADQLQETVKRSKRNAWSVLNSAPLGICVTDARGHFELVNPAFCDFYGYTQEELIGRHFECLVSPETGQRASREHRAFIEGIESQDPRREWQVYRKSGEMRTILSEGAKVEGDDGQQRKVTFIIDITARKELEERLREANDRLDHLASYDSLTGLMNRRAGLAYLEEELKRCRRYGGELSIVMFDLDRFKRVNDTYGHAAGDTVLKEVTATIAGALRDTDIQVRLGGEEFLIIMPETSASEAQIAAERLLTLVEERTFTEHALTVTLSAGVASTPTTSAEQLIERSDQLMYASKACGRNQIQVAH